MDAAANSKATIEPELDEVITSLNRVIEALRLIGEDGDDPVAMAALALLVGESLVVQVEKLEALAEQIGGKE